MTADVSVWMFLRIVTDAKWPPFDWEHFQIHFQIRCNLKKIQLHLKIDLKILFAKLRPYCLGLNVLTHCCRGEVASILWAML